MEATTSGDFIDADCDCASEEQHAEEERALQVWRVKHRGGSVTL